MDGRPEMTAAGLQAVQFDPGSVCDWQARRDGPTEVKSILKGGHG